MADYSKKPDVLKIIATVPDFNEDERSKTGLGKGMGAQGWIQSWFGGSPGGATSQSSLGHRRTTSGEVQAARGEAVSVSRAAVGQEGGVDCFIVRPQLACLDGQRRG